MTALHLACLPLLLPDVHRWAARRGLGGDEGRALHHLLAETFGKGVAQPFRLMVGTGGSVANVYAYTPHDATALRATARETGLPDALAVCDPTRLDTKEMPSHWREGRRLAFDLKARPVRRLVKPAGAFSKGAEIDAYVLEVLRRFPDGPPQDAPPLRREEVYRDWLAHRLAGAARLEEVRLAAFHRQPAWRGAQRVDGPEVTFHGHLVVEKEASFARLLATGVGRHAAYGYGMLLLRPAR
ncbi:type I-E CRISPR-associated protein Cas6/Cse3/CasE [Pararhodospirillum oryzae]|uniref:CRISPR-associated protein Cse3 n=1 Tax=Pararhodospirillum oryzae TaxID=478448 RepID=A0A512H9E2_9PROT|nr:type I-E CRISPR-associated protein Cas6/Cse3/CasE [Pararhodospirillum oryzae]GEO82010.1 CRISPR-associated protein Cse3 [Pararhodospirillum oryzae]